MPQAQEFSLDASENEAIAAILTPQEENPFCCQKKYFAVAAGEIIALQILPWYFNRHVSDDATAVLSLSSWKHNVRTGFEWDPNAFSGNMFAHPFHGNVFFNTARSNGYTFWESVPFAFAGSFIWEMFGENNRPAINDWAMTSLGGITIGEALHRAAIMVRDNTATGSRRAFKELAGFLIDPVGGMNRAFRGEMSRVGPNPKNRYPSQLSSFGTIGYRAIGEKRVRNAEKAIGFAELHLIYGNPYEDYKRPFDFFRLSLQLNSSEKTALGLLQVHAPIYGSEIKSTEKNKHIFSIDMMYDYTNNNVYEVGGQSFAFSLRSLFKKSDKTTYLTLVQPSIYVMTGIISEYVDIIDRDYDFGSGFGLRLQGILQHRGVNVLRLGYRGIYTHTVNGEKGNQIVHFALAEVRYPIWHNFGITATYILYMRDSYFRDFPNIHKRNPELRIGASFLWR